MKGTWHHWQNQKQQIWRRKSTPKAYFFALGAFSTPGPIQVNFFASFCRMTQDLCIKESITENRNLFFLCVQWTNTAWNLWDSLQNLMWMNLKILEINPLAKENKRLTDMISHKEMSDSLCNWKWNCLSHFCIAQWLPLALHCTKDALIWCLQTTEIWKSFVYMIKEICFEQWWKHTST